MSEYVPTLPPTNPLFLLKKFIKEHLIAKIALLLFLGFLLFQLIFLIPIYLVIEELQLKKLETIGVVELRTLFYSTNAANASIANATKIIDSNTAMALAPAIIKNNFQAIANNTPLKGLTMSNKDGSLFLHLGEKPSFPMNVLPSITKWITPLTHENGTRYDVFFGSQTLGLPFDITARLDSTHESAFLSRIIYCLLFMFIVNALLLAGIALWIMNRNIIKPLFDLKNFLHIALQDPKELKELKDPSTITQFSTPHRIDEIGEMMQGIQALVKQLTNAEKTIKAHEAILEMGVEERSKVMTQITNYNVITGLPNRNLLKEHVTEYTNHAKEENKLACILIMELRDFREITHAYGQELGTLFLKEVAKLLSENIPIATEVAHITFIRFAIARNNITSSSQIINLAQWVLDLFTKPLFISGQNILSTINIGISVYPNDGDDSETLLVNANVALDRAKAESPNSYQFYESGMNQNIEIRRTMLVDLHYAIEKEQFVVFYQPQIDVQEKKLIGLEALVRWQHPEKGMIPPSQFISLAEESGLITSIGEWVLRTACHQVKQWQNQGYKNLCVAVNLSSVQFRQKNIVDIVNRILLESELPAECLELEITESGIMNNLQEAISTMKAFHGLGIQLSIDDFGTGYSSLSYLKRFPVQKLKIDQSFVKDLGQTTEHEKPLADIIILLGHSLNLRVIAEGVETEAQFNYLKERHCDEVQGYYFGKPEPKENCPKVFETLGL